MCEQAFQQHNTAQQNSHCLHNFDLSEYRQILSDLAVWIFQGLVKLNGALIHSLIGQHEASCCSFFVKLSHHVMTGASMTKTDCYCVEKIGQK